MTARISEYRDKQEISVVTGDKDAESAPPSVFFLGDQPPAFVCVALVAHDRLGNSATVHIGKRETAELLISELKKLLAYIDEGEAGTA